MPDTAPPSTPLPPDALWRRWLPFLAWRGRITRDTLRADAAAGLTGAVLLVPQGVAFATIAGMPPEYGLYAAMLPAIVAALFGSSWHLVSGPTTAISIVIFATLSPLAEPGSPDFVRLALTLAFLSGMIQLVLGLLKLGTLVNFISHTVVVGFTAGAALLIAASQLQNFFGLPIERGAAFHQALRQVALRLPEINPWVTAVGLATLAGSFAARRWLPRVPYMIAGLVAGSLLGVLLNLLLGQERTGIAMLSAVPGALPPLSAPDLSPDALRVTLPIALALAMLSLTEAVSIARAIAIQTGQRIDGSQEFVGQGLSNIAAAFTSGYPTSGSFNRSALNLAAGARTPMAAVFSSLILVGFLLFLAPLMRFLPMAAMAGILFLVAWGLIDRAQIRFILRGPRAEVVLLGISFAATLLMNLEYAIYVGVLVSLVMFLHRTSRPVLEDVKPAIGAGQYHFSADTGLPDCPQIKMLRVGGPIYFGAVDHLQGEFEAVDETTPSQKHLVLVCPGVGLVDLAGGQLLAHEARRRRALGGDLFIYNLRADLIDEQRRSGIVEEIGEDRFIPLGTPAPMTRVLARLDPEICAGCTRRIFRPCREAGEPPLPCRPTARVEPEEG